MAFPSVSTSRFLPVPALASHELTPAPHPHPAKCFWSVLYNIIRKQTGTPRSFSVAGIDALTQKQLREESVHLAQNFQLQSVTVGRLRQELKVSHSQSRAETKETHRSLLPYFMLMPIRT